MSYLAKSYEAMYSGQRQGENTSFLIQKHSQAKFENITYGSLGSRSKRSSSGRDGQVERNTTDLRPAQVLYQKYPLHQSTPKPVEVWCAHIFEPFGPAYFLPVQRIHSQFVAAISKLDNEEVLFVCPLQQKEFLSCPRV